VGTDGTIELFSYSTGSAIRTIGSGGGAPGQIYNYASGLSFTLDGQHIIMADYDSNRVSMFKVSDGSCVKLIADGVVGWAWNDVLVAPNGELYIADVSNNRVLVYDPTFTTLTRSWSTTDSYPVDMALAGGGSKLIVQFNYAAASRVYV
jgi:DNA-binding beta-propeller fold protein YncE